MPYKVYSESGKFCVHKHEGGKMGATVPGGCHPSQAKADAHMRALYAAEGREKKELDEAQEELVLKEMEEKGEYYDTWVPGGVTSFKDLDTWRATQEELQDVVNRTNDFMELSRNIMWSPDITEKAPAITALANEFSGIMKAETADITSPDKEDSDEKAVIEKVHKSLGDKFKDVLSGMFGWIIKEQPEREPNNMMLWKEGDTWHWMARYSNKFRDRDNPPEIIAEASHLRFVDRVDKGLAPLPELWFWHRKELRWGQAKWIGYDNEGFAMAMGDVYPWANAFAESLATIDPKELRVSHGMPIKSIARDPDDPTVIIEHDTAEISPLPEWAAANLLTSFIILNKEETMALPADKRKALIDMGIPGDVLDKLEKQNADVAKEATDAGIESKEADAAPAATPPADTPPTTVPAPSPAQPVQKETEPAISTLPSVQDIANAVSVVLNDRLTAIDQKFTTLESAITTMQAEIKALKETDENKVAQKAAQTPAASLTALIARSVIGNKDALVDGRTSLASDKPKETAAPKDAPGGNLGVWIVDNIIQESESKSSKQ